jgi:DNA repair protein RadC
VTPALSSASKRRPKAAIRAAPPLIACRESDPWFMSLNKRERSRINSAMELIGQYLADRPLFDSPAAVMSYLQLHMGKRPHEVFCVLFLDSQHRLIATEEMFRGTLNATSVYPREVVLRALHHHAAAVLLAHNHPSGTTEPSRADETLTQTLKAVLSLVDVRVLDHFIITAQGCRSMAEMGMV